MPEKMLPKPPAHHQSSGMISLRFIVLVAVFGSVALILNSGNLTSDPQSSIPTMPVIIETTGFHHNVRNTSVTPDAGDVENDPVEASDDEGDDNDDVDQEDDENDEVEEEEDDDESDEEEDERKGNVDEKVQNPPRKRHRRKPQKNITEQLMDLSNMKEPYLIVSNFSKSGYFTRRAVEFARAFPPKTAEVCSLERPIKQTRRSNSTHRFQDPIQGIYYNKVPKSASSTLASINRRIALHWGYRLHGDPSKEIILASHHEEAEAVACSHNQAHVLGAGYYYGSRVWDKSFLWASVRHPASRALSRVFFLMVSQRKRPAEDDLIISNLQTNNNPQAGTNTKGKGGFTLQYMTMNRTMEEFRYWEKSHSTVVKRPDELEQMVKRVIDQYDFIAVTERLDESLVALKMLLGLRLGDILYTSAKVAGAYYHDGKRCIEMKPTVKTPKIKEFLESDTWEARSYGDYLLYEAANLSLDMTIDKLGRDQVQETLKQYREAQKLVNNVCWSETFPPCSSNGTMQVELSEKNCYGVDEGCGYACIDRLVKERGW